MKKVYCDIKESLGTLATYYDGETKEVNLVSWNHRYPKYDIRQWSPEHKPHKGIALSKKEARTLYEALKEIFENE